jgi:nucleotide-binding universal stress UspA family protein
MADRSLTQRILVPLDGSDIATVAIPYLRAVAMPGSEIVLVRIVSEAYPGGDMYGTTLEFYKDVLTTRVEEASAYLDTVSAALEDLSPNIVQVARAGMAANEILEVADDQHVDVIIMATRGHGAFGRALLGSTADRVARASRVPVLLIHAGSMSIPPPADNRARIARIVVPLDGSARARAALPVAAELAQHLSVSVHVVQVAPSRDEVFSSREAILPGAPYGRLVFAMPTATLSDEQRASYESMISATQDRLEAEARRLRATGADATAEVLIGETVPSIVSTLRSGDVVVMSSHGEGGIRRWQLGSVAEKLIHQAAAPVMLVPNPERLEASPA